MPDYRGRKGNTDDLFPRDKRAWAREIWADQKEVAKLESGDWLLREAAKELQLDQELVDALLSQAKRR